MSFHPLIIGSETFNGAGPGKYVKSTVTFGGPTDWIRISPASYNGKTKLTTCGFTRFQEKDVTTGTVVSRESAQIQLVIQLSPLASPTDVDNIILSASDFFTGAILTRVLNGEY